MTNLDIECFDPGWDEGPAFTGGPDDGYFCELEAGHEGPHSWDDGEVTWDFSYLVDEEDFDFPLSTVTS